MSSSFNSNTTQDWTGVTSTPTSSGCSYSSLNNYNKNTMGVPVTVRSSFGTQAIPNYSAPGYGTLVDKSNPCSGYFTIDSAYGNCATDPSQSYSIRKCQ